MDNPEKAKILLQYGSFKNFFSKEVLKTKDIEGDIEGEIRSLMLEYFHNLVDDTDVEEEVLEGDYHTQDIDSCTFPTWDDAWEFYKESTVNSLIDFLSQQTTITGIKEELQQLVESVAEEIYF